MSVILDSWVNIMCKMFMESKQLDRNVALCVERVSYYSLIILLYTYYSSYSYLHSYSYSASYLSNQLAMDQIIDWFFFMTVRLYFTNQVICRFLLNPVDNVIRRKGD